MKGLWLENKTLTFRDDIPVPVASKGEVLVKVVRGGICKTDLELIEGYYDPFTGILGHEFVGKVVDENVSAELKGKRVVGDINFACNDCKLCKSNLKRHCANRTVLGIRNRWGTFAEYLTIPKENLFVVPDELSDKESCFVEPLAAALQVQEQIQIHPNDRVAVVGDGKLGLLISKTIKLTGCDLTVYGHHAEKLALLKKDGINTKLEQNDGDFKTFDVVVESTGNGKAFTDAVNLLRPRGTLIMKSTHHRTTEINASDIVVNELTMIGSRCGPFDKAINLLKSGSIDLTGLLSKEFLLDNCLEAIDYARRKDILKVHLLLSN